MAGEYPWAFGSSLSWLHSLYNPFLSWESHNSSNQAEWILNSCFQSSKLLTKIKPFALRRGMQKWAHTKKMGFFHLATSFGIHQAQKTSSCASQSSTLGDTAMWDGHNSAIAEEQAQLQVSQEGSHHTSWRLFSETRSFHVDLNPKLKVCSFCVCCDPKQTTWYFSFLFLC